LPRIVLISQIKAEPKPDTYLCTLKLCIMNWILLIIAGLFEVGFATCLGKAKETTGIISTYWMGGFFICLTISMVLLYKATQTLPIGTAYAVWTGVGAVGTVLMGIFVFKEPADFWRVFFLTTLIASIVGLKFVSN
jgi:quaternary ammonium compound-resistance protein SugE